MIKILVVDDSVLARQTISSALEDEPSITVTGTAPNGEIGLKKIERLHPDLVLLDVEMPVMDGMTTLRIIREIHPSLPVIMFSSPTQYNAKLTIEALESGATDFVEKPTGANSLQENKALIFSSLVPKIKALFNTGEIEQKARPIPSTFQKPPATRSRVHRIDVVAIGVSTGGPSALAQLIPSIPADLPVPIVIVQHMPAHFTSNLAKRLDSTSSISVREGSNGDMLTPGIVWIAPGGYHMVLKRVGGRIEIRTNLDPPEEGCRPAVDVLFRSVADVYGPNVLGVILTGMGKDGLKGSETLAKAGGRILTQDEASSVVWGMPRAVAEAGLPEKVVPLDQMGFEIVSRVKNTQFLSLNKA